MDKKAIYQVSTRAEIEKGFESAHFLTPKLHSDEKWRPILNLKPLNKYIKYQKFKMEGTHTLRQLIRKNDFMTKIDLKDAYMHVPVHRDHQKFLQFRWKGSVYRYTCLPFGLQSAPRIFTKMMRPVMAALRQRGIRLVVYLDDILLLASSKRQSIRQTALAKDTLTRLGFIINHKKSCLTPSQKIVFLGNTVDSVKMELTVPPEKLRKYQKECKQVLRRSTSGRQITIRKLAGIIGKLNSLSSAIETTRLHLNGLHRALRYGLRHRTHLGWATPVLLQKEALANLKWWISSVKNWQGKTLLPITYHRTLYTDASDEGYGGAVLDRTRTWPEFICRGFWTRQEKTMSINQRELTAVQRLVLAGIKNLKWKNINLEIYVDNITTMFVMNKGDSTAPHLSRQAAALLKTCYKSGIRIICRYVPGTENSLADALSRWSQDRSDYQIHHGIFQAVDQLWGPHTVDWTATRHNTMLPRFCSRFLDDRATYVDVLRSFNAKENGFCNPPFALIPKLLGLLENCNTDISMVVPIWMAQPWWPVLLSRTVDFPVLLPRVEGLFRDHHHQSLPAPKWDSAVFRLSSDSSKRKDFLRRCGTLSRMHGSRQLYNNMKALGVCG